MGVTLVGVQKHDDRGDDSDGDDERGQSIKSRIRIERAAFIGQNEHNPYIQDGGNVVHDLSRNEGENDSLHSGGTGRGKVRADFIAQQRRNQQSCDHPAYIRKNETTLSAEKQAFYNALKNTGQQAPGESAQQTAQDEGDIC